MQRDRVKSSNCAFCEDTSRSKEMTESTGPRELASEQALEALSRLFGAQSHDRQVFCVLGTYDLLRPFQKRMYEAVQRGDFRDERGDVRYISLTMDLYAHLRATGQYDKALELAQARRDSQLRSILSTAFRDLVTKSIEAPGVLGLVIADFELLYAYELGGSDISLVRQVAINGKKVCLLLPGRMHDRRFWIFDEDPESREEFPDALLFTSAGWVIELKK
jgi:hypothetical protein